MKKMKRNDILSTAKPLSMIEENYCKVLDGHKTQTRRVREWSVKPRYSAGDICYLSEPLEIFSYSIDDDGGCADVLYHWKSPALPDSNSNMELTASDVKALRKRKLGISKPTTARFMRKSFARHFVIITQVRTERLQEINRGSCMEEGCPFPNRHIGPDPRLWFIALWDSINPKENTWQDNPMVWVYSFKLLEVEA